MLKKYLSGKGLDVSRKREFNEDNCEYYFVEPDNLYTLQKKIRFESMDFIYSKNLINETKYYRILIKEWLNFCRTGGYIIIEMKSNKILNFNDLLKECIIVLRDKGEIIEKRYDIKSKKGILIINKIKDILAKGDSIDKWSFGIIPDGRKEETVDKCIQNIIGMKIPNFEIIVCGNYKNKNNYKIRYIQFDFHRWLTKKKNIICENAKYENIIVLHDRMILDKNWYDGMKKYGNYFEALNCIIIGPDGKRNEDWMTYGIDKEIYFIGNLGLLEYKDWDKNIYFGGGMHITKKSVWKECWWEELFIWGFTDDLALSKALSKKGFVMRFNPYSLCKSIKYKGKWFTFKINKKRFILPKDSPIIKRFKRKIKIICKKYILPEDDDHRTSPYSSCNIVFNGEVSQKIKVLKFTD